jgi:septum formation protein
LDLIGLPFEIRVPQVDEQPFAGEPPTEYAQRLAETKAAAVRAQAPELPVLAADTVVAVGSSILGKPRSKQDARRMLFTLADSTHEVHTAMALFVNDRHVVLVDTARVEFAPMSDAEIEWYIGTGEPMDKAGAYGVQGIGGLFVRSVEGSPHTVVGLPIHRLAELFSKCDLDLWRSLPVRHRITELLD